MTLDQTPTMASIGEITYADGYRILVPQPGNRCMSCLMVGGWHLDSCRDWATTVLSLPIPELRAAVVIPPTSVIQPPQIGVHRSAPHGAWWWVGRVSLMMGLALVTWAALVLAVVWS